MAEARKSPATTIAIDLRLRYTHPLGALAPYFDGLKQGQARASRCLSCDRTWFPPRLLCPHDRHQTEWVTLSGRGRIISVTSGISRMPLSNSKTEHCFALVAVDGAENTAFARVVGDSAALTPGTGVRLVTTGFEALHPAQCACFVLDEPPQEQQL